MSVRGRVEEIEGKLRGASKPAEAGAISTRSITPPLEEDSAIAGLERAMREAAEEESSRADMLAKIPREVKEACGLSASADVEAALEAVAQLAARLLPKHTKHSDSLPDPRSIVGSTTPLAKALNTLISEARGGNTRARLYARHLHVDYLSLDGLRKVLRKLTLDVAPGQDPYVELTSSIREMISEEIDLFFEDTIEPETVIGRETPVQQALSALVREAREGGNRNTSLMLQFLGIDRYTLKGAEKIDYMVLGDLYSRLQKTYGDELNPLETLKEAIRLLATDYVTLGSALKTKDPLHPQGTPVLAIDDEKSDLENALIIRHTLNNPFAKGLTSVTHIRIDGREDQAGRVCHPKLNHIPECIGALSHLTHLELPHNNILKLPESLGKLKLKQLNVEGNRLLELPKSLASCETLLSVNVSHNRLISIDPLIEATYLIRGKKGWEKPNKALKTLNISHNNIAALPEDLSSLANCRSFDMSGNSIRYIPESIGNMTELQRLYVQRNNLVILPESLGELKKLEMLIASSNNLTMLPTTLDTCDSLYSLSCANNKIRALPALPGELIHLDAQHNEIEELPATLGACRKLKHINVSDNCITRVTPDLRKIGTISILDLRNNELLTWLPPQLRWVHFETVPKIDDPDLLRAIGFESRDFQKTVAPQIIKEIAFKRKQKDSRYTYFKVDGEALKAINPEDISPHAIAATDRFVMRKTRWKKEFAFAGMWPF